MDMHRAPITELLYDNSAEILGDYIFTRCPEREEDYHLLSICGRYNALRRLFLGRHLAKSSAPAALRLTLTYPTESQEFPSQHRMYDPALESQFVATDRVAWQEIIVVDQVHKMPLPSQFLLDMFRALADGGIALLTTPFHAAPIATHHRIDIGRYTPLWWGEMLTQAGFSDISIETLGTLPSAMVEGEAEDYPLGFGISATKK